MLSHKYQYRVQQTPKNIIIKFPLKNNNRKNLYDEDGGEELLSQFRNFSG